MSDRDGTKDMVKHIMRDFNEVFDGTSDMLNARMVELAEGLCTLKSTLADIYNTMDRIDSRLNNIEHSYDSMDADVSDIRDTIQSIRKDLSVVRRNNDVQRRIENTRRKPSMPPYGRYPDPKIPPWELPIDFWGRPRHKCNGRDAYLDPKRLTRL